MKKIIVIITLLLIILTSCFTVPYDLFNGKGMDYVIISSDKKMIDPFDEKYLYVDKIQKQKYIQEIENKYNINIVFDDFVSKGEITFKNANVIPTANASILVAIANTPIVLKSTLSLMFSHSSLNDSRIIFPPINPSKTNVIQ